MPLTPAVPGLVLAEDIASDLDMPSGDTALMDGYAVRCLDLAGGPRVLSVVEEVTAGCLPEVRLGPGQATRIMTGAQLPEGADAVVMVEHTRSIGESRVEVTDPSLTPGQHILTRGREMRRGETVLTAGTVLRPPEIGLCATLGRPTVQVYPLSQVAVLATGNELVEVDQAPAAGQIHNSNGPMLCAQVWRAAGRPLALGIARDQLESLRPLVAEGLRADVLVLSGGVSAGIADLVPVALQEAGVEQRFHKVAMRPGKPIFFGVRGKTLVFGLPGNPVSSLVGFELFVRPALRRLAGHADPGPSLVRALLAEDFACSSDRPTYHPALLETHEETWRVQPMPWFGSSNLRSITRANAFVLFPAGDHRHRAGQIFPVLQVAW
jgi:molybdopterin molybdotransferase